MGALREDREPLHCEVSAPQGAEETSQSGTSIPNNMASMSQA